MKIQGRREAAPTRSTPGRFQQQVKKGAAEGARRLSPGVSARGVSSVRARPDALQVPVRGAFASAEHLGQVRQGATAEAHRLRETRGEAHQTHQERLHHRLGELLARELAGEPLPAAPPSPPRMPAPETPGPGGPMDAHPALAGTRAEASRAPDPAAASTSTAHRVEATLALIEKIEVFVKSQRPALALRLGGSLDATVEVERTGPRQVALRIQGRRGPLASGELSRIREALASRGLSLSTLSST